MEYSGPIIDGDSHLFEDWEAINAYLPSAIKEQYSISRATLPDGTYPMHIGKRPISYGEEYSRPDGCIPKPGALHEWLKALHSGQNNDQLWVPKPLDSLDGAARIRKMDEFGVEASVLFPGEIISVLPFINEVEGLNGVLGAVNRWILDKWGMYRENRLLAMPVVHLEDLDWAIKELDWAIKNGARGITLPCGPFQKRSPADPIFDPFWARLNEVGGVVGFHIGQPTYMTGLLSEWSEPILPPVTGKSAWDWMNCMGETPVIHTLSSMIYLNFFSRFPRVKALSAENGAEWVPAMLKRMDKMRGMARNGLWPCGQMKERPSAVFKRHVFVVPYPEDDLREVIDKTGTADCFVMGSDYPHTEGVSAPAKFLADINNVTAAEARAVMYENGRRLLAPAA